MKHTKLYFLLSSVLLSSVAAAEVQPLTCEVTLHQARKRGALDIAQKLTPLSAYAQKFSAFTFDPKEGEGQAWIHQNVCVSSRDFKNGAFKGNLCVLLMTRPEGVDAASPALEIHVFRDGVPLDDKDVLRNRTSKAYGGLQAVVPFNPEGQSFLYAQRFAKAGVKGELEDVTISCSASS